MTQLTRSEKGEGGNERATGLEHGTQMTNWREG